MHSFPESMIEYKKQLQKGYIQVAYQGLMDFFKDLKSHFADRDPTYSVSSSIYYGYMDMTYFSLVPEALERHKLKIALVFLHDAFTFEVWLSGGNRDVQAKYWELLKGTELGKYQLASNPRTVDYAIRHILVEKPEFNDLEGLTKQIDSGTLEFVAEVERLLARLTN
jgi:hypothetical protein